jgi:hypothetical protein
MLRLVQTIALLAALAVLATSLWQDWGLVTTAKRLVVAYLGFFGLATVAVLALRAGTLYEKPPAPARSAPRDDGDEG